MLSKAEIRRRKQQSARDKQRHREQQEEERRREQSRRDRARKRQGQANLFGRPLWTSLSVHRSVSALSLGTDTISRDLAPERPQSTITSTQTDATSNTLDHELKKNNMDFHGRFGEKASEMFNNSNYADVKINVGDADIHAHRFVLCLQSQYFEDALNGAFMEGSTKTLKCPVQKEHAYLRVLKYLYTGNYDEEPSSLIKDDDDPELLKHPRVYFLADSFFLNDLKASTSNHPRRSRKILGIPASSTEVKCAGCE